MDGLQGLHQGLQCLDRVENGQLLLEPRRLDEPQHGSVKSKLNFALGGRLRDSGSKIRQQVATPAFNGSKGRCQRLEVRAHHFQLVLRDGML